MHCYFILFMDCFSCPPLQSTGKPGKNRKSAKVQPDLAKMDCCMRKVAIEFKSNKLPHRLKRRCHPVKIGAAQYQIRNT